MEMPPKVQNRPLGKDKCRVGEKVDYPVYPFKPCGPEKGGPLDKWGISHPPRASLNPAKL
ncbi:hypothetical protein BGS_0484 [Beggiatoa sp. SS]|nr:hypothetical protein BGS_0484 [Beggiatoa sp. SS]